MSETVKIHAASDKDLHAIFQKFGLLETMERGACKCSKCGRSLIWQNFGALVVNEGALTLFCELPECIAGATELAAKSEQKLPTLPTS
jgi:hypothetical protein